MIFATDFDCYVFCKAIAILCSVLGFACALSSVRGMLRTMALFLLLIAAIALVYSWIALPDKETMYKESMDYFNENAVPPSCIGTHAMLDTLSADCLSEYVLYKKDSTNRSQRYYNYIKEGN